jgi:hypothetical protein
MIIAVESSEARRRRWRVEASRALEGMGLFAQLRIILGGRIYVRDEQLQPDKPDNPTTPLYLFSCFECKTPDIDYAHAWGRGRLDCSKCTRAAQAQSPQPDVPPLAA